MPDAAGTVGDPQAQQGGSPIARESTAEGQRSNAELVVDAVDLAGVSLDTDGEAVEGGHPRHPDVSRHNNDEVASLLPAGSAEQRLVEDTRPDDQKNEATQSTGEGRRLVKVRDYLSKRRSQPDVEVVAERRQENRSRHRSRGKEPEELAFCLTPALKVEAKQEQKDLPVDLLRWGLPVTVISC